MEKIKSLVICASPLQVMIVERIIALHPEEEFHVLIYSQKGINKKYQAYADRIKRLCLSITYIKQDVFLEPIGRSIKRLLEQTIHLTYYRFLFKRYREIQKVYVASYEMPPIRSLFSVLPENVHISSFDDGLINLLPKNYNLSRSDHGYSRVFALFGLPRTSEIRSRIEEHYTIYDAPNAAHPSPKKIDLFSSQIMNTSEGCEDVTIEIFLGQPLFELEKNSAEKGRELAEVLVHELGCHTYLPHPRENYHIGGVEYIDTSLIAEDYILQELEKDPKRRYTLYSYFSTTLMNLKDHPRIKMVACRPGSLPERWHGFYPLLKRLGIEIRDFPNL